MIPTFFQAFNFLIRLWYKSLRTPTRQDLLRARQYVNSKWRCLRRGEKCTKKERNLLRGLTVATGASVIGTGGAIIAHRQHERALKKHRRFTKSALDQIGETAVEEESAFNQRSKDIVIDIADACGERFTPGYKAEEMAPIFQKIDLGINPNINYNGNTALIMAIRCNFKDLTTRLLAIPGINLNKQNGAGNTALTLAGSKDLIETLLKKGADPNAGDEITPLIASINWLSAINLLLEYGANPNQPGQGGTTPLIAALLSKHINTSVITRLIEAGADVNKYNRSRNETPLSTAISRINALHHYHGPPTEAIPVPQVVEIIQILRKAGADPDIKNYVDETAYDVLDWHVSRSTNITPQEHETLRDALRGDMLKVKAAR